LFEAIESTLTGERTVKEDAKEIEAVQEAAARASGIAELADLQLTLVGGGCGEVVLV
jgi:hypothetical protein